MLYDPLRPRPDLILIERTGYRGALFAVEHRGRIIGHVARADNEKFFHIAATGRTRDLETGWPTPDGAALAMVA